MEEEAKKAKIIEAFISEIVYRYELNINPEKEKYLTILLDNFVFKEVESHPQKYITAMLEDPQVVKKILQDMNIFKKTQTALKNEKKIQNRITDKVPLKEQKDLFESEGKRPLPAEKTPNPQGMPRKKIKVEGEVGLKQELEAKGKQKCKFYPFCKNIETCKFFHPSEKVMIIRGIRQAKKKSTEQWTQNQSKDNNKNKKKSILIRVQIFKKNLAECSHYPLFLMQCSYFPNCRYGEGCLYEHEACKFKEKCNKFNCPFAHPFKKNVNPLQEIMRGFMQSNNPLRPKKKSGKPQKQDQTGQDQPLN